jgi:SPP1 family predicted phage head-tail adaptor
MRAGQLRERVEIQRRTSTRNSFNEPVESWAVVGTTWAEVKFDMGREEPIAQQVVAGHAARFIMRSNSLSRRITATDRLLWNGQTWDVFAVIPSARRDSIEARAAAVAP